MSLYLPSLFQVDHIVGDGGDVVFLVNDNLGGKTIPCELSVCGLFLFLALFPPHFYLPLYFILTRCSISTWSLGRHLSGLQCTLTLLYILAT